MTVRLRQLFLACLWFFLRPGRLFPLLEALKGWQTETTAGNVHFSWHFHCQSGALGENLMRDIYLIFFYHRVILEIKKKKLNLSNAMKSLLYTFNVYFFQVAVSFSKVYCYRKMSCVTKLKKNSYIDILVDVEWNYISHVSLPFWRLYPWVLLVLKFFCMTV